MLLQKSLRKRSSVIWILLTVTRWDAMSYRKRPELIMHYCFPVFQRKRQKRQAGVAYTETVKFPLCFLPRRMQLLDRCMDTDWSLTCRMKWWGGIFRVECRKMKRVRDPWDCRSVHIFASHAACCDLKCT